MKKIIISAVSFFIFIYPSKACEVCERNQPKLLQGIVHGAGPESNWDYISMALITTIALFTLFYTIKYLVRPGEKNATHIKFSILN